MSAKHMYIGVKGAKAVDMKIFLTLVLKECLQTLPKKKKKECLQIFLTTVFDNTLQQG
jgi:hypothetical protein